MKTEKYLWVAISIPLLLLSLTINFMQNDEWNRYLTIERFHAGDFSLIPETATTFYSQGLAALLFSYLFGISNLPFLTMIVSIGNAYVFYQILKLKNKDGGKINLLLSLLLLFNPIHFYSSLGFMTENYLLFYSLIGYYFFTKYQLRYDSRFLLLSNLFFIAAFFAKQSAIIFLVSLLIYSLFKRNISMLIAQLATLLILLGFYYYAFPLTQEMTDQKDFLFSNFTSLKYVYSVLYVVGAYLSVFSLPILVIGVVQTRNLSAILYGAVLATVAYLLFKQTYFPWKEFPYLPNTFTAAGYFRQGIEGDITGSYILANSFRAIGPVSIFLAFSCLADRLKAITKHIFDFETISLVLFFILLVGIPFLFDRYVLIAIPIFIVFLLKVIDVKEVDLNNKIIAFFVGFFIYICIDYSLEFVQRERYMWATARGLININAAEASEIRAGHSWNKYYRVSNPKYIFTFTDLENGKLVDSHESGLLMSRTKINVYQVK